MNTRMLPLAIVIGMLGTSHAEVRYTVTDLGVLPGTASPLNHAFVYDGNALTDLGVVAGFSDSYARGLNNNDPPDVVGRLCLSGCNAERGFLYSGGVMTVIGTLGGPGSDAFGVNRAGQVVGGAEVSTPGSFVAFLYQGGTLERLDELVPAGFHFGSANAINDAGQIVTQGGGHVYLLTPIAP